MTIACHASSALNRIYTAMEDLKKIESNVLITMIAAYSYNYEKGLAEEEFTRCKNIVHQLKSELESRKNIDLILPQSKQL